MLLKKLLSTLIISISVYAGDIITKQSDFSVDETVERIKAIVEKKGLHVFGVIDHRANAQGVNMQLDEARVVIFGNPQVGTLLMQEDIQVALDLPLKILVYTDAKGAVNVAYRDGSWLKSHHFLQTDNLINKVNTGMDKITTNATTKGE